MFGKKKIFFAGKKKLEWLKNFGRKVLFFSNCFFEATVIKSLYTPAEHFKYIMDRGTEKREEHVGLFLKKFP